MPFYILVLSLTCLSHKNGETDETQTCDSQVRYCYYKNASQTIERGCMTKDMVETFDKILPPDNPGGKVYECYRKKVGNESFSLCVCKTSRCNYECSTKQPCYNGTVNEVCNVECKRNPDKSPILPTQLPNEMTSASQMATPIKPFAIIAFYSAIKFLIALDWRNTNSSTSFGFWVNLSRWCKVFTLSLTRCLITL